MASRVTLQCVLNTYLPDYTQTRRMDPRRWSVCQHIQDCRTAAMGGQQLRCVDCGHETQHYYACRDRHCPQCQQRASRDWQEHQAAQILPVDYHHLVFTLPHELNGWMRLHPETIYSLLFRAVWQTLKTFGADPKRLGGELGMTAVLHTWGQSLSQHVHLHCLVPGGVLTEDGQWRSSKSDYLFPVRALSRHFRGLMVSLLRTRHAEGELPRISDAAEPARTLGQLMEREWVVYSKPCLRDGEQVVKYLSRYTHRIAISNDRLLSQEDGEVAFSYKDYRAGAKHKVMILQAAEFIRRFLQHVLARGFMRIRHYGYLANCCRVKKLSQIQAAIKAQASEASHEVVVSAPASQVYPCPVCQQGWLQVTAVFAPQRLDGG
jgi:hypothetical protein